MKALANMTEQDLERILDRDYPRWVTEFADQYDLRQRLTGQLSEENLRGRVSRHLGCVLSAAVLFTMEEEAADGTEARETDER